MDLLSALKLGLLLFSLVINIFLAFVVYKNNPRSATNILFGILSIVTSAWLIVTYISLFPFLVFSSLFWGRVSAFLAVPQVTLFFLLSHTLPKDKLRLHRGVFYLILVLALSVMAITLSPFTFTQVDVVKGSPSPTTGFGIIPFVIYCISFSASAIYILTKRSNNSFGIERQQLKFVLYGILLMLGLIIATILLPVAVFQTTAFVSFAPLYSLVFLGATTYAIIRHKLLDIRIVVVRSVVYSVLIALYAMFYTADVFLISFYFFRNNITIAQAFIFAILTLFVAFTFQPLKRLIEEATDDLLFKNNYSSNGLVSRLTKIMASTLRLDALTKETLQELLQTIHITRGAFVILRDKDGLYPIVSEGFEQEPVYGLDFIRDFSSRKRIFVLEEEDDEKLKQTMRDANLTVILPLFEDDHIQGVLLLGEKKSGEIYSQQDIQVLEIFGPEVSVAIQNAKAYEEISRFNVTLKDEVDKATKDLQNANERLKDLDKLKDEFVSIASHELRTPMTAIRSYLWMALAGQGGDLNDKQRFYVQRGYNSVERLIKLVNDMLNVSRIESGRISLEMKKTDMTGLVQGVVDEVTPRADELGLHVRIDGGVIPSSVLADSDKIKEVLFNLIGNSLKFTPKDGTITVSFVEKDGMVETRVSDTGAGIEQSNLPNLFQKFGILPGSYAANQSAMGTGLGLYICKSIIEFHDGKIWAESAGKGKGTTFVFSLPVFSEERLAQFHEKHKNDHQEHVGLEHTEL